MRLLVAEDEKRLNKIICEALEDEGYSVDACFDGEQALEYAAPLNTTRWSWTS